MRITLLECCPYTKHVLLQYMMYRISVPDRNMSVAELFCIYIFTFLRLFYLFCCLARGPAACSH